MSGAEYWIDRLNLKRHPEGGYFRQTYRAPLVIQKSALPGMFRGPRSASTAIYFLLEGDDFSALHRLASDEVWHFYAGDALLVHTIDADGNHGVTKLGSGAESGEQFQCIVPAWQWFGSCLERPARPGAGSGYALVGCTVAPGFDFEDFELADRSRLIAEYPRLEELIGRLTRSPA